MATVTCYWRYVGGRGNQWLLARENGTLLAGVNEIADGTLLASGPLIGEGGHAFNKLDVAKRSIEDSATGAGYWIDREVRYGWP